MALTKSLTQPSGRTNLQRFSVNDGGAPHPMANAINSHLNC
jgi:hypothetical protein